MALLGLGSDRENYGARQEARSNAHYKAHRVQDSVTHRPSSIKSLYSLESHPLQNAQRMGHPPGRRNIYAIELLNGYIVSG
jgi:hypothetical protein